MRIKHTIGALCAALVAATAMLVTTPAASAATSSVIIPAETPVFIDHVETGFHLTPDGWSTGDNAYIDLWEAGNDTVRDTEKWEFDPVGPDTARIRNASSGKCLQPKNDDVTERVYVTQRTCGSSKEQNWVFKDTGDIAAGSFTIASALDDSLVISPSKRPTSNDQHVWLRKAGPYLNQVWRTRRA